MDPHVVRRAEHGIGESLLRARPASARRSSAASVIASRPRCATRAGCTWRRCSPRATPGTVSTAPSVSSAASECISRPCAGMSSPIRRAKRDRRFSKASVPGAAASGRIARHGAAVLDGPPGDAQPGEEAGVRKSFTSLSPTNFYSSTRTPAGSCRCKEPAGRAWPNRLVGRLEPGRGCAVRGGQARAPRRHPGFVAV